MESIVTDDNRQSDMRASHRSPFKTAKKAHDFSMGDHTGTHTSFKTITSSGRAGNSQNPRQLRPLMTEGEQPSAGDISHRYNQITDARNNLQQRLGSKMLVESDKKSPQGSAERKASMSMSPNRFGVDPIELIKRLGGKESVDDDAFLLINANETLAKDGIRGKIAEIGIGFGTGRHTSSRRAEYYNQKTDNDSKILSILKQPKPPATS